MAGVTSAVEVERFDISQVPDHGRPRVAQFRVPKKGSIDVRVERETGALWLFVNGPSGGDRGEFAVPLKRACDVLAFVDAGDEGRLLGSEHSLSLRVPGRYVEREFVPEETTDRLVHVNRRGSMGRAWIARFDAAALDELRAELRKWAVAVIARDPAAHAPSRNEVLSAHTYVMNLAGRAELAQDARMADELRDAMHALARAAGPETEASG